jgi:hypothetical protein
MTKKTAYTYAYLLSFLYVGFGTFTVLSLYPDDPFCGHWVMYSLLFTFPVSVISFGIRYAEPDAYMPVILIQLVMFLLTGWIIYRRFFRRKVSQV